METIYRKARAKINLNLLITGIRDDGYHNIESVFHKINLYDEIWMRKTDTGICELETNLPELNCAENSVVKAYESLKRYCPKKVTGIWIKVKKKIPMQAGLGGGSTDCATALLAMNTMFSLNLSQKELETIGKSLGADVVPCMYDTPLKAEGIGEKITVIPAHFPFHLVVIKPKFACDTRKMYQQYDKKYGKKEEKLTVLTTEKIEEALLKKDGKLLTENLFNVFEEVTDEPEKIQSIKKELIKERAAGSLMTGSGSCVYGIFLEKEKAKKAYITLKEKYDDIFLCSSYSKQNNILGERK